MNEYRSHTGIETAGSKYTGSMISSEVNKPTTDTHTHTKRESERERERDRRAKGTRKSCNFYAFSGTCCVQRPNIPHEITAELCKDKPSTNNSLLKSLACTSH